MDEYAVVRGRRCARSPARPRRTTRAQFGEGNIYYGPALMWHELRKRIGDDAFWTVVRDGRPATRRPTPPATSTSTGWSPRPHVDRSFFEDWLLSPTTPPRS